MHSAHMVKMNRSTIPKTTEGKNPLHSKTIILVYIWEYNINVRTSSSNMDQVHLCDAYNNMCAYFGCLVCVLRVMLSVFTFGVAVAKVIHKLNCVETLNIIKACVQAWQQAALMNVDSALKRRLFSHTNHVIPTHNLV